MRGKLGDKIRLQHILDAIQEIEWGQIKGMRNVFVHEYFGVDSYIVREIIKGDIPNLKVHISEILNSLN